jgi:hypothetical protein
VPDPRNTGKFLDEHPSEASMTSEGIEIDEKAEFQPKEFGIGDDKDVEIGSGGFESDQYDEGDLRKEDKKVDFDDDEDYEDNYFDSKKSAAKAIKSDVSDAQSVYKAEQININDDKAMRADSGKFESD